MNKPFFAALAAALCLASAAVAGPDEHHKPNIQPNPAWEKLKSMVGDWKGKNKEKVSYKLVSAGTALVETMGMGTEGEMVSVYHPDGERVVMTHYCAMGNQPRMRTKASKGAVEKVVFTYLDGTNLKGNDSHVMNGLTITFKGPDAILHEWVSKTKGGKTEATVFELSRKK